MTAYTEYSSLPSFERRTDENKDNRDILKWSSVHPVPAVGEKVGIKINRLGTATVRGYFSQSGWLGLLVDIDMDTAPEWFVKQNKGNPRGHIFGAEFEPLAVGD